MILCCGEALIDMLPCTSDAGQDAFAPACGGAVFNTAIALGRLGAPAGMLTGLSTDLFGELLSEELRASNVNTSHVITSDRPTTLAFVTLDSGQASYSFFDENSAGRMLSAQDLPAISSDVTALYFSCISLVCEPAADTYAALAQSEGQDRVVMLDPNIRQGFITNEARYRERLGKMIKLADIVKVSDEDLEWIDPSENTLTDKAKALLDQGPSLVIVTKGADGATAYMQGNGKVDVPAQKAQVVDTVGAGDTFNGGVLAALSASGVLDKDSIGTLPASTIEHALTFGAKVAGVTVSRAGANPPWADAL